MSATSRGSEAGGRGILVVDFGSQYTQLILKRLRQAGFFCEIDGPGAPADHFAGRQGIVLSGGPSSAGTDEAPRLPSAVLESDVPVLGICYGMQLLAHEGGGRVAGGETREYGAATVTRSQESDLLEGVPEQFPVWMSHGDAVHELPAGFVGLAATGDIPCAVMQHESRPHFGLQFHPEVHHTPDGGRILENFARRICGMEASWEPGQIAEQAVDYVRGICGDQGKVLIGLSGGVDSSVTAAMCIRALGPERVVPVLVDTGFLRADEAEEVRLAFKEHFDEEVTVVDASAEYFAQLDGVDEPEKKRKIIGRLFIEVFEREAKKHDDLRFLAQGTLYPDLIESMPWRGPSAVIKSHHNVGGLPERLELDLVEPLRMMFKDDVRKVGLELGLPAHLIGRHPFPGPGLAIRILGAPSREKAETLRKADRIFLQTIRKHGWYDSTWQAFAVLLPVKTVGVMGDQRTYEDVLALRAVNSVDGMTADWTRFPYELLAEASTRIVNEVKGVNRVVYDITSKPPGTIEWE